MIVLPKPIKFIWDKGNQTKSFNKHKVTNQDAEEIFFDSNKILVKDKIHSTKNENRYIIIGQTSHGRTLYSAFTIRKDSVRIISSGDLDKKEHQLYEKTT